ncbi:hypothetical protein [Variovorax sp. YR216]|uniref:hypothetical protein n=1 Tax=Variovorax sp. YR216 TaxID=1882828 RepID=UPI000899A7CE|nr:hypothetical protein [Variovorax sp. YR216]SEB20129.1 hypothetical protein SAMN05444680_11369 [Variovorax sp. YR216]
MKIELHIDQLVIDPASGPAHDRDRLARAVSQALAQRMDSAQRIPASERQGQRLEQRIAAAVHQAIPGASRGGRP